MAEAFQPLEYTIKTAADVRALQSFKKEAQEALKNPQADAAALKRQLDAVDRALASDAAQAAKLVEQLQRVKAAQKAINPRADTSAIDRQIADTRLKLGDTRGGSISEQFQLFKAQVAGFQQDFSALRSGGLGAAEAFGSIASRASSAAGPLAIVAAGVAALTIEYKIGAAAVEAYAQKERMVAALDQALAQRGQLLAGYREELQQLANAREQATGIDDSKWLAALTRLTQMGSGMGDMRENLKAVEDLAGLMGGDVERAAVVWGRAMNGNFEVLRRYGIEIDSNLPKHEQLQRIMEQLAQRGGGQLAVQMETVTGRFTEVKNATEDVMEGAGNLIARTGVLQRVLESFAGVLGFVADLLPGTAPKLDGIANKFDNLGSRVGTAAGSLDEFGDASERANSAADEQKQKIEELAGTYDALRDSINKAVSAAMGKEDAKLRGALAKIDEQEAKGAFTPAQANVQREAARRDSEQRKRMFERSGVEGQIDVQQRRVADLEKQRDDLKRKQEADQSAIADRATRSGLGVVGSDPEAARAASSVFANAAEAMQPQVDAAKKSLEQAKAAEAAFRLTSKSFFGPTPFSGAVAGAQKRFDDVSGQQQAMAEGAEEAAKLAADLETFAKELPALREIREEIEKAKEALRELTGKRDVLTEQAASADIEDRVSILKAQEELRKESVQQRNTRRDTMKQKLDNELASGVSKKREIEIKKQMAALEYAKKQEELNNPKLRPEQRELIDAELKNIPAKLGADVSEIWKRKGPIIQAPAVQPVVPVGAPTIPSQPLPIAPPPAPPKPRGIGPADFDLKPIGNSAEQASENLAGAAEAASALADLATTAANSQEQLWAKVENLEKIVARLPGRRA